MAEPQLADPLPSPAPANPVDKRPEAIRAMFGRVAPVYDLLNHLLSASLDRRWRRLTVQAAVLAGMLLVEEAGGKVTDYTGGTMPQNNPQRRYLASNGSLHETMVAVLQGIEGKS